MNKSIDFPLNTEYPSYAEMYMKLVIRDGSLLKQLKETKITTQKFISSLSEEELNYRYKPGKWSLKEVLVHIIDDERIYAYRALTFARNDKTELPGFDEERYTKYADVYSRTIESIIEEYDAVRMATITLFQSFSDEALLRIGTANKNKTSVRALGYHILGHELHHIQILQDRYLKSL
ncbi:DinB family protein [Aquimarina sp. 2201CG5-10]|uniref:DinB family protein n=1 Tax=Aquimarina callyspongiae TaxID=3098150 RepID=UPI002AB38F24|nr:DinB family protein [Aquimarina sp. 2201CG5-10]MDY8137795.1 DinB family protein [Aquimarina sp. 2201CG5-10]